jgi:hypothetical protein
MLPNNRMFQESGDHQIHARGYEYNRQEAQQQIQQAFSAASYAEAMQAEAFYYETQEQFDDSFVENQETEASSFYKDNEFKLTHRLTSDCHSYIKKYNEETNQEVTKTDNSQGIEIGREENATQSETAKITEIAVRHLRPGMPPAPPPYSDSETETPIEIEIEHSEKEAPQTETATPQVASIPVTRVSVPTPPSRSLEPKETPISILIERSWPPKKQDKADSSKYVIRYYDEATAQSYDLLRQYVYLGVVEADPDEYYARYGSDLRPRDEFAPFVNDMKSRPECLMFADECECNEDYYGRPYELEGDVEALKLIDLDEHGLSMYKSFVEQLGKSDNSTLTNLDNSDSLQTSSAFSEERKQEEELWRTTEINTSFNRNIGPLNEAGNQPTTTTSLFIEEKQKEEMHEEAKEEEMVVDDAAGTVVSSSSSYSASATSKSSRTVLSTVIEE